VWPGKHINAQYIEYHIKSPIKYSGTSSFEYWTTLLEKKGYSEKVI
jgi:hypothetical protein